MNDRKPGTTSDIGQENGRASLIPDDTLARARETAASIRARTQEGAAAAKAKAEIMAPRVTRVAKDWVKRAWPVVTAALASAIARIRRARK